MVRVVWTMLHPLLSRGFRTNDSNFCYCHLAHPVFPDMMIASTVSRKATNVHKFILHTLDRLELSQLHPQLKHMRPYHSHLLEIESHQLVNSIEMVQGKINQKLKEAKSHFKQLEPYKP